MMAFIYCVILGLMLGKALKVPWRWIALFMLITVAFLSPGFLPNRALGSFDIPAYDLPFKIYHPLAKGPQNRTLSDIPLQIAPWQYLARKDLVSHFFPFLNPYVGCGQPFMGNSQSSPFNPFFLLTLPLPFDRSFVAQAFLKIFVALLGMYCLARGLQVSQVSSFFAALAYGFGGSIQGWLLWPQAAVLSLYPLQLFFALRFYRSPSFLKGFLFTSITAFMVLSGHPETLFFTQASLMGWFVVLVYLRPRGPLLLLLLFWVVGFLLSAPFWIPVLYQVFSSFQYLISHLYPKPLKVTPLWLPPFFFPRAFGFPTQSVHWGPSIFNLLTEGSCGFLSLPLAFPFFFDKVKQNPIRSYLAIQSGIAFLFVFNVGELANLMLYFPLLKSIHFRYLGAPLALSLSLLAGMGLDHLLTKAKPYADRLRRTLPFFLLITLMLYPYCVRMGMEVKRGFQANPALYHDFLISWLLVLGAILLLVAMGFHPKSQTPFSAFGLAMLNGLLLFQGFFGYIPTVPKDMVKEPLPFPKAIQKKLASSRIAPLGSIFFPNLADYYGLYDIRAHDPMAEARYLKDLQDENLLYLYRFIPKKVTQKKSLLRALSVGTLWTPAWIKLPKPYTLLFKDRYTRIYQLPKALPFFSFPKEVAYAPLKHHLSILSARRSTKPLALLPLKAPKLTPGKGVVLSWAFKKGNRFEVRIKVKKSGLLMANWTFLKGYRARCDGKAIPIYPVNQLFMGVEVPKGYHKIELLYLPPGLFLGEGGFFLGCLLLFLLWKRGCA